MMHDELPYVPLDVVAYLEAIYTPDFFIEADLDNNDERIGYMKGTTEVIDVLRSLAERND